MKNILNLLSLLTLTISFAQFNHNDSNRIGILVGANQINLSTNNFVTTPQLGWNAGLTMRSNFYNNWDVVYSLQFSESRFSVSTQTPLGTLKDVKYTLPGAQISFLGSYRIIENVLNIDFGPILQVNGKLGIDSDSGKNTVTGTKVKAADIVQVSNFNFYPTIGITFGFKHIRANVSYQYSINNMFSNFKDADENNLNFNGNAGIVNTNLLILL